MRAWWLLAFARFAGAAPDLVFQDRRSIGTADRRAFPLFALALLSTGAAAVPVLRGAGGDKADRGGVDDQKPARGTTFAPYPGLLPAPPPPAPTDERLLELEAANAELQTANAELQARVAALEAQVQRAVDAVRVAVSSGPPLFMSVSAAAQAEVESEGESDDDADDCASSNRPSCWDSVAINDLNSMGNEIRFLPNDFGPKRDKEGTIVRDADGEPVRHAYPKMAAGSYAVLGSIGMVVQLVHAGPNHDGTLSDDWAGIVVKGAKSMVPLLGLINPALGLGVGILLSLFTPSKSGARAAEMLKLYNQIMCHLRPPPPPRRLCRPHSPSDAPPTLLVPRGAGTRCRS